MSRMDDARHTRMWSAEERQEALQRAYRGELTTLETMLADPATTPSARKLLEPRAAELRTRLA